MSEESEYLELIGAKIKLFRVQRGMSHRDLAKLIGCSHSLISLAERGLKKMDIDKYRALAVTLGVPFSLMFSEREYTPDQLSILGSLILILKSDTPTPNLGSIRQLIEIDSQKLIKK